MEEDAPSLLSEIHDLVEAGQLDAAAARLAVTHPADSAQAIAELGRGDREVLLASIGRDALARIIEYLPDDRRGDIIEAIAPDELAPLLDEIDDDIVADILHDLPDERAVEILRGMRRASVVAPLLGHADESAGGHMTRSFVSLNGNWSVGRAITYLRRLRPDAESAYYLYVIDAGGRLEGIVSLRDLIIAAPETPTVGDHVARSRPRP